MSYNPIGNKPWSAAEHLRQHAAVQPKAAWETPLIRDGAPGKRPRNKTEMIDHPLISDRCSRYTGKRDTDTPEWDLATILGWRWSGRRDRLHEVPGHKLGLDM